MFRIADYALRGHQVKLMLVALISGNSVRGSGQIFRTAQENLELYAPPGRPGYLVA
jgi:hypothetical protein